MSQCHLARGKPSPSSLPSWRLSSHRAGSTCRGLACAGKTSASEVAPLVQEQAFVEIADHVRRSRVHLGREPAKAEVAPPQGVPPRAQGQVPPGLRISSTRFSRVFRRLRLVRTGFIVTKDGYILTNNHVVTMSDRPRSLIGNCPDARQRVYRAKVIGNDPTTDVASQDRRERFPTLALGNDVNSRVVSGFLRSEIRLASTSPSLQESSARRDAACPGCSIVVAITITLSAT